MMSSYFVSDGEADVQGPFVEAQLRSMWQAGKITANAMVCLEGTEDWILLRDELAAMEALERPDRDARERRLRAVAALERSRVPQKSEGVALLLNFFIPGLGHLYAGEVWQGLAVLVLDWVFMATAIQVIQAGGDGGLALIIAGVLWLVALIDAPRAVRRFNAR